MDFKYTKHQVARGSRADAETFNKVYLIKMVSMLRATYQIKLLAFKAVEAKKKLVLRVPEACRFHSSLEDFIKQTGRSIIRENI
jgi:hypothetical protein